MDDQFPDHPKVVAVGPAAGWLYVCGLCYAARMLTDGFIPTGQVGKLADLPNTRKLVDALVRENLWERVEGGYRVHDFLDYNPSAEKVRGERDAAKERMKRGRSQNVRPNNERTMSENGGNILRSSSSPIPVLREYPPTPLPGEPPESSTNGDEPPLTSKREPRRTTTGVPLPGDFPITDERRAWAAELGFPAERVEAERDRFLDYHGAKGNRFADWGKAWQTWLRNEVTWAAERGKISALPRYPNAAEMNRGGQGKVVL